MRKLNYYEIHNIYEEYRDVINPIQVVDFESAIERCKQALAKEYIRKNSQRMKIYREKHPEYVKKEKEYKIRYQMERGCKFHLVAKRKYGSLSMYHYSKLK